MPVLTPISSSRYVKIKIVKNEANVQIGPLLLNDHTNTANAVVVTIPIVNGCRSSPVSNTQAIIRPIETKKINQGTIRNGEGLMASLHRPA
jgi:hypothetical protein